MKLRVALLPLSFCLLAAGCSASDSKSATPTIPLTMTDAKGKPHSFQVEVARTPQEQEKGLMFRTDIPSNGGMLFAPYPPEGGPPKEASFWMKNTPSALDIIYIRKDGTIARIVNAQPFDETPLSSGEPVSAVLELNGGRTAALGIAEGDKVSWQGK